MQNRVQHFENPLELLKLAEAIAALPDELKQALIKLAGVSTETKADK